MEPTDDIRLSWCEKHEEWWVMNCPDCMAEDVDAKWEERTRRHTMNKMPEPDYEQLVCNARSILKPTHSARDYLRNFAELVAKTQRELLKGWIPLPSDERMADITAKAGGLPSPEWKTILRMLQEGDDKAKT